MKRSVQFLACIGLALALPMSPALAHTQLINSAPSAGEVLSALPTKISLIFDDPLIDMAGKSANEIAVRDASGHEIAIGVPNTEGVKVSVALPAIALTGQISVAWRVVAGDGHPERGSFTFSVTGQTKPAEVKSESIASEPKVARSSAPFLFIALPVFLVALILIRRRRAK